MARANELRELDDTELLTRYAEAKEEMFNLRFQHATGRLDASSRLGQVKKDIARIATIVRQREIEAAETQETEGPSGPMERETEGPSGPMERETGE